MRRALWTSLLFFAGAAVAARGQQLSPPGTGGVAALMRSLSQLGADKRVLVIGAHPDDEDTELLALLSRGMGAQAAYLSLSRGEGGQNLIGEELGPELGIIRSGELLAARSLDGAQQFFTRAYDFGFSKTAEESFRFWPRDSVLKDVVDVIRRFRPQVIVAIFSGTPRDGHGQHQVSGVVARQAFDLLRDSTWGPVKFYRSSRFDTAGTSLVLEGGALDPVTGLSYHQLAMLGRSQHRSQDMGQIERPGPSAIRVSLVATKPGVSGAGGLFAGVDTTLHGLERYTALIDSARHALQPFAPRAVVPYLARALAALGDKNPEQRRILEGALADASGTTLDAAGDDGIVIPGQRLQVEATLWNAGDSAITLDTIWASLPAGWSAQPFDLPARAALAPGTIVTRRFVITVAANAERSEPYFLRRPLVGDLYNWTGVPAELRGLPFEPPALVIHARATIAGQPVELDREIVYRYRDQGVGEIRKPIFITEPFDVTVAPGMVVWPVQGAAAGPRRFTVSVTNRTRGAASAVVRLTVPVGWATVPPESLSFQREDEEKSVTVTVEPPAGLKPGVFQLAASVRGPDGRVSDGALAVIDYPHIRPRAVVHASTVEVRAADIALPPLARVGYVRGASDRVPEALAAVGVPIEMLSDDTLARGDLSKYDAIVIGSRAYETDPGLVAANGRLLDYGRAGGLILVQYQQYPFIQGNFAPYRMTIAQPHDRVTDETAPVTELDSTSSVFHSPNQISAADWQGWIQERGLYFAHDWDSTYQAVLETHDAGGPPLAGGLLIAPLGKGEYVYTGLAFFRELPGGVVGSYRLFANLLGLKKPNVP
ncbi:MAG TPA: PIG-L family deacetylase [Gemmatimonadales bacterium]|nr:PIG-L family deacetylase [Gemmatimonadales bacterium]